MLLQPVQLILNLFCHFLLLAFVLPDQHSIEQRDKLAVEVIDDSAAHTPVSRSLT